MVSMDRLRKQCVAGRWPRPRPWRCHRHCDRTPSSLTRDRGEHDRRRIPSRCSVRARGPRHGWTF